MLHADSPLPLAEIARAAGVPYVVAQSAIRTLERRGMVIRQSRAGRDEFGPNATSTYYPMAHAVALVDLPIDGAVKGHHVAAVFAYGSLAVPGGGSRRSDIDLLVVGDVPDPAGLRAAMADVGARYGRAVDLLIITPEELTTPGRTETCTSPAPSPAFACAGRWDDRPDRRRGRGDPAHAPAGREPKDLRASIRAAARGTEA